MLSKECRLCHRIGSRDFLAAGCEEWECGNDRACKVRRERRDRAESVAALFAQPPEQSADLDRRVDEAIRAGGAEPITDAELEEFEAGPDCWGPGDRETPSSRPAQWCPTCKRNVGTATYLDAYVDEKTERVCHTACGTALAQQP